MTNESAVLLGTVLVACSGLIGLAPSLGLRAGLWHRVAAAVLTAGCAAGAVAAVRVLGGYATDTLRWSWALPGAEFAIHVDALSASFLLPIFLIAALGAWYGVEYWPLGGGSARSSGRVLFFYGLVTAGMALVVVARNGILFLMAWETMALSAFFLVTAEDERREVREAGWIYFVATHASTLLLFGLFGLLWAAQGSFTLDPIPAGSITPALADGIFLVALAGFGLKAGLFPLHIWLPPAHASAPSHVSALMSGVLIKMGVYGVARICSLFNAPPLWWGELLLGLGVLSGILGVAFAIGQHDLKRLLAYHSVENIGIIFMGLGLAVSGRALGDWRWVALGLAAALLHTWNHGLFKTLLFYAAGAVLHATGSREMDRLGGLAKAMPRTALFFCIGAAAICGLPPLNGFVSEWLLYLGMFGPLAGSASWGTAALDVGARLEAAIGIPALALIGALALACFVKAHASVFLGESRTDSARNVHECGPAMWGPMAMLAALCAGVALAAFLIAPGLDRAVADWVRPASERVELTVLAPLPSVAAVAVGLWVAIGIGVLAITLWRNRVAGGSLRERPVVRAEAIGTWDCGYVRPNARIQYTSSSFAQLLVALWRRVLFPEGMLRLRAPGAALVALPGERAPVFPQAAYFESRVPDTVLDRLLLPVIHAAVWTVGWLRLLQRGRVQDYLLYVFLTLLTLLLIH